MVAKACALVLAATVALGACTPVQDTHGFVADIPDPAASVQAGVDTKATVVARLGSPSTTSAFEGESAWYYIRSVQERLAFFESKTVDREIIAIRFGENDVVASVDVFGMERGRVVAIADGATPTRGRELGVIEQLFGNIGRTPLPPQDEDPRDRRRP